MNIDWSKLTFHYTETDYIVRAACKNGVWEQPYATRDKMIPIHAAATGLHYGQECFEGLKGTVHHHISVGCFQVINLNVHLQQSGNLSYQSFQIFFHQFFLCFQFFSGQLQFPDEHMFYHFISSFVHQPTAVQIHYR